MRRVGVFIALLVALLSIPGTGSAQGLYGWMPYDMATIDKGFLGGALGLSPDAGFWVFEPYPSKTPLTVGSRCYYAINRALYYDEKTGTLLNFTDDLNFSSALLLAELFADWRLTPKINLSYTFTFPRSDYGSGPLPGRISIGGRTYAGNTVVAGSMSLAFHRFELEYRFLKGDTYRFGLYAFGEYYQGATTFRGVDENGSLQDTDGIVQAPYAGIGGVLEYAPLNDVFFKCKVGFTKVDKLKAGIHVDGNMTLYPQIGPVLFNMSAGYRYRSAVGQDPDNNLEASFVMHGPYAQLGVYF